MCPRPASPSVLFLHGLAGYGGEWRDVASLLGVESECPDLPGHGSSFDPLVLGDGSSTLVDDIIDAAVAATTRLAAGAGAPVAVVGQSMGGLVALRVAHRVPELVSHVVLVEADTGAMSSDSLTSLSQWFDRWPDAFATADEATQFFGSERPSTPAWVAGLRPTPDGLVRRFDAEALVTLMADLAGGGSADIWQELTVPATLILAEHGVTSDLEVAAMLDAQPDTTMVRVAGAGHDVHLDQPAAVAEAIASTLGIQAM